MEKHILTIVNLSDNTEQNITFEIHDDADDIIIKSTIDKSEFSCCDRGYFTAFQKIRDEFLTLGFGIKCNGSRINAVQSGMMSGSERIYLVKLDTPAAMKDIVNIFDYAEISDFPNTSMQNDFTEKWFESLKAI